MSQLFNHVIGQKKALLRLVLNTMEEVLTDDEEQMKELSDYELRLLIEFSTAVRTARYALHFSKDLLQGLQERNERHEKAAFKADPRILDLGDGDDDDEGVQETDRPEDRDAEPDPGTGHGDGDGSPVSVTPEAHSD